MSQEQKSVSFQEYFANMRAQVIVSYDNAKENALKAIDDLAQKFVTSMNEGETLKKALETVTDKENKSAEKKSKKD